MPRPVVKRSKVRPVTEEVLIPQGYELWAGIAWGEGERTYSDAYPVVAWTIEQGGLDPLPIVAAPTWFQDLMLHPDVVLRATRSEAIREASWTAQRVSA